MTFMMSTPSNYLSSVKKENVRYPVLAYDMIQYSQSSISYWTGYYSARTNFKKQTKDASALYSAHNALFARRLLDQRTTDAEAKEIVKASNALSESIAVSQNSGITGTVKEHVNYDFKMRLVKGMQSSEKTYSKILSQVVREQYGIDVSPQNLVTCIGSQNDTVKDCPVSQPKNLNKKEFLVTVHNS